MDFFCLLGSRRFTRADRPNRFVGDDDLLNLLLSEPLQPPFQLLLDDWKGFPVFPLLQGFPDAEDGKKAMVQGSLHPLVDRLIGLSKELPSLRMADDHILATQIFQHQGGYLAL